MEKITGFLTKPKTGNPNWLVVVKKNDQIENMFYMGQDGQFLRSIDAINFKKEYEFAKNWKHTIEMELVSGLLDSVRNCLNKLQELKPTPTVYSPFAGLAEKIK